MEKLILLLVLPILTSAAGIQAAFAAHSPQAPVATVVWTGNSNSNWNIPGNWQGGQVPTANDDVSIPATAVTPVLSGISVSIKSLTVETGGFLSIEDNGALNINGATGSGIVNFGTIRSFATIRIGETTTVGQHGIENRGIFSNLQQGEIYIHNTQGDGIRNAVSGANVDQRGLIEIGLGTVGGDGIWNAGTLECTTTATTSITQCTGHGIFNSFNSTVAQNGVLHISFEGQGNDVFGIANAGSFQNQACGLLQLQRKIFILSSLTNAGIMVVSTTAQHSNGGTLTNTGLLAYPQGNPIAGTTNNGLVSLPISGQCDLFASVFQIGNAAAVGVATTWYSDEALSQTAGTYDPANNTFTSNALPSGDLAFYFEANIGTCTRAVPVSGHMLPCYKLSGHITWANESSVSVPGVVVNLTGDDTGDDTSGLDGYYEMDTDGGYLLLSPSKQDTPRQGVDAADVTRIRQHVLATVPFTKYYERIAADVNQSNSITNADAAIIQQALLGNGTAGQILDNPAWRFMEAGHTFPNPAMPWAFPQATSLLDVDADVDSLDFHAFKIGDANGSWGTPMTLSAAPLTWQVADQWLEAGRTVRVAFAAAEDRADLAAWQFALRFDPAQVAFGQVMPRTAVPLSREEFGVSQAHEGEVRSVFAVGEGQALRAGEVAFEVELKVLRGGLRLREVLRLDEEALPARVYGTDLKPGPVSLAFRPLGSVPPTVPGVVKPADAGQPTFELYQNEPNPVPADGATTIRFQLPEAAETLLTVRDASGQVVYEHRGSYEAGQHAIQMGSETLASGHLSAQAGGVFLYTLQAEGAGGITHTASRRMVVVR